jgi:hypothetical protein
MLREPTGGDQRQRARDASHRSWPQITHRTPGGRVRSEDQPLVVSLRWACRSWQAASSRQAHLLWRMGLPQRISLGQSVELPLIRIILRRGPAQPHIKQVRGSTAGHPQLFGGRRADDGGVPESVVAAGHAWRIASPQASPRSSFTPLAYSVIMRAGQAAAQAEDRSAWDREPGSELGARELFVLAAPRSWTGAADARAAPSQARARRVPGQVVCHGLSRSLADSLARVQTWIHAGEADQRASLIRKGSPGRLITGLRP